MVDTAQQSHIISGKMAYPFGQAAGRWALAWLVFMVLLLLAFRASPGLDIWISEQFFHFHDCAESTQNANRRCGYFPARESTTLWYMRQIGLRVPQILAIGALVWLIKSRTAQKRSPEKPVSPVPLLGVLTFLIGPLLIINGIFKPGFGRPRPIQTELFSGHSSFVLPGDITDQCTGNCSFVSGEAGAAFWMMGLVFLLPPSKRLLAGVLLFVLASAISFLRVIFGGHFFSDVVIGGAIAIAVLLITAWALQTPMGRKLWSPRQTA